MSNHPSQESSGSGNRLAAEASPYLLLHAHNPVDWRAWNAESLAAARDENKLIFLSIGYSSCHWCHVMEHESFSDERVGRLLDENFISIKVDREERPDVDEIYMTALVLHAGHGGWPLSMFLTPDAKPFYGGTYFPPSDRNQMPGFPSVLQHVAAAWRDQNEGVRQQADQWTARVQAALGSANAGNVLQPAKLDEATIHEVGRRLVDSFDETNGGFAYGPTKFPNPSNLMFLLNQSRRGDAMMQHMFERTLDKMAEGGIRDHIGGGFHRYTVDPHWRIPHFEKMLYDNGQLASVYAEGYALLGRESYRRAAEQLCDFVVDEMTDAGGGFYSALDADSEGVEGKFYVWTREELEQVLSGESRELFFSIYGIDRPPNFEGEFYFPQLSAPLAETAAERSIDEAELERVLAPIRGELFNRRASRVRPATDVKILAAWNGLMIRGMADAGRILKNQSYLEAAARAAQFVLEKMTDGNRMLRSCVDGKAYLNGYLQDYALMVDGLIALERATGDSKWLDLARRWTDASVERFWDEQNGGFFFTSSDHEQLIARSKESDDGVIPSGASVSAGNLLFLAKKCGEASYRDRCRETLASLARSSRRGAGLSPSAAIVLAELLESDGT